MQQQKTIQQAVAEKIASCGETVANTVIDKLADVEIHKRIDTIIRAIRKVEELEKELKKINKADVVNYVNDERTEIFSDKRYQEIKKSKEKIENLKKLIADTLEKNTDEQYNKLNGQIGGTKSEDKGEDKQES